MFAFKQFTIHQDQCAMKVSTDACLFGALINPVNTSRALDIGTGTGLLSLILAQKCNAQIDAIEIDGKAVIQARSNILASTWANRIQVFHQAIQSFSLDQEFNETYDLIFSNPPFYENQTPSKNDQKKTAWHSDSLSLNDLAKNIKRLLSLDGSAWILYPAEELKRLLDTFAHFDLFPSKLIYVHPSKKKAPNRVIIELKKLRSTVHSQVFTIYDELHQYTEEFIELLKPYYLKL